MSGLIAISVSPFMLNQGSSQYLVFQVQPVTCCDQCYVLTGSTLLHLMIYRHLVIFTFSFDGKAFIYLLAMGAKRSLGCDL